MGTGHIQAEWAATYVVVSNVGKEGSRIVQKCVKLCLGSLASFDEDFPIP